MSTLPWIGEFQVLVKVVETVEKVSELSSQQSQDITISELTQEIDEIITHAFKELGVLAAQKLESLLSHSTHKLFRVNLNCETVRET